MSEKNLREEEAGRDIEPGKTIGEEAEPGVFLGVDSPLEQSRAVILPVPYEGTVSYRPGTRFGPGAIIDASAHVELYDQELDAEPYRMGIHTAPPVWPNLSSPQGMIREIREHCRRYLNQDKFLAVLGGEHSVTVGSVQAHQEKHLGLCVLQVDAHADLRDSYHHTKWGHASVMRRVGELCPTVGVGIRSLSREEMDFAAAEGRRIFFGHQIREDPDWIDRVLGELASEVYVTVDLDGLDPGIMPAVGTPVPGGLSWQQTLDLLGRVAAEKIVVGFDVVELAPIPGQMASDFTAARLVYKMLGSVSGKSGGK
jgi:agmatinase